MTSIDHGAFEGCSSLISIIFKGNAPEIKNRERIRGWHEEFWYAGGI
ncbi:MAG: hypothetical protein LUD79_07085 [Oscillospiraceae bacterium]|nr:hypothetical protein [Oscillospiraceae bacterium]